MSIISLPVNLVMLINGLLQNSVVKDAYNNIKELFYSVTSVRHSGIRVTYVKKSGSYMLCISECLHFSEIKYVLLNLCFYR